MGDNALFLVSPSSKTNVKMVSGDLAELQFFARKVFSSLKGKKGAYSVFVIQWQDIPETRMRIVERAWEDSKHHWTRRGRSRRVNGNNSEFTIPKALEAPSSNVREEMIQNSALLIEFSLSHAQPDLHGSKHILVANLLSLLIDCIFFKGHKETCLNLEEKNVKESINVGILARQTDYFRSPNRLAGDLLFLDETLSFIAEELSHAPAEVSGRRSHGTSYKATLDNGYVLTMKWLREGLEKHKKEFAREAKKFANIRHPNLVSLRGYYWGPREHEKLILSDYVSK